MAEKPDMPAAQPLTVRSPESPETINLRIDSLAYGGKGVARSEGKVWFVADTLPGDVIEARPLSDHGRYGEAQPQRIIKRSSHLESPACPVADACGGCSWMGLPYPEQLEHKKSFVVNALKRIGKIQDDTRVEILGSPAPLSYRNRILIRLHVDDQGRFQPGYFRRQSRDLVPITACKIAAGNVSAMLATLSQQCVPDLAGLRARIEIQEAGSPDSRQLIITVYPGDGDCPEVRRLADLLGRLPGVAWAGLVFDTEKAPWLVYDRQFGLDYHTRAGLFQQVNVVHNHTLRSLIRDFVHEKQPRRILDVSCGSGNLSLALVDGNRYVEGVEISAPAIRGAIHNQQVNNLPEAVWLAGDAEKHLWKCARGGEKFDLVILDPPRQGMHKSMVPLKILAPETIIYVSCDPTTLARDISYLCRKDFYRLTRVTALDFFPQTWHVETVAVLEKSPPSRPAHRHS